MGYGLWVFLVVVCVCLFVCSGGVGLWVCLFFFFSSLGGVVFVASVWWFLALCVCVCVCVFFFLLVVLVGGFGGFFNGFASWHSVAWWLWWWLLASV